MFENETSEDPKPNSKPPYLFLIPVALGIVGFIGYQTVRMGTATSVERSPFAIDTSVAQAAVQNGVITVHAREGRAPHLSVSRVAMVTKQPKPDASPTGKPSTQPSTAPSTKPTATPAPEASPTKPADKLTVAKAHSKPHHRLANAAGSDAIANEPVPHIERPISANLASNVAQTADTAAEPPGTDLPIVRHQAADAQPAAPAPAAATAKPVQVALAPAAPAGAAVAAGPVNASDRIVEAKMTYAAAPDYPDMARDQGVRGTSVVFVTVDGKGAIVHLSIASSSGNGSLDRAALSAARSSRYVAPKVDGKPAIETYRVTYDFAP